ncbi:Heme A synthase [Posidoniimonas corsicana]|uniref:Heme A synthase n=1 Tax=Posidoniimonas corsicana TaxID=1938618 RepID=A0A5C5V6K9_9BACT|nr:COX15/CtaA family protein [Posidoniimonas corsicana]TWT33573.1 Heme A synthase [Posidoniimonas corsicana]
MTDANDSPRQQESPWPRRWAVALCCCTFPLLWVGGLVTSTDAGMAVPDWPTTYGYNMFAYPWQTWMFGPWDLLVEHGHRLLGSLVGLLTIGLLVAVWRSDSRRWLRWLTVGALVLVIAQGVLGGMRVILNERQLAMLHGCTGPLFFALACVLLAVTSRAWFLIGNESNEGATNRRTPGGLLAATALFAYLQLVLGAQLRHVPVTVDPWAFAAIVKLHLVMAAVVSGHVVASAVRAWQGEGCPRAVRRLTAVMTLAVVVQLSLGVATWLLKYGRPGWASAWLPDTMGAVVADGWAQTHIATAHSAVGSLILGLAAAAAAIAIRSTASPSPTSAVAVD